MADAKGVDHRLFRRKLRAGKFPWHISNDRWMVVIDSDQHRDMARVLATLL
jgi:hypothetical protein